MHVAQGPTNSSSHLTAVLGWHNAERNNKRRRNRNAYNMSNSYASTKKKREIVAKVSLVLSRYVLWLLIVIYVNVHCLMQ
jgi:ABC-type arginine transport system ATPase subunit